MMATADVLSAYLGLLDAQGALAEGADFAVICEHHEDWAVLRGGQSELVSAKHREASVGAFTTIRQLLDKGGVLHLFDRWVALDQTPMCRLVTTAGLANDAALMASACQQVRSAPGESVDGAADAITKIKGEIEALKEGASVEVDTVTAFLACLRFQAGEPRRDHLPDMAATRFAGPIAQRLNRPEAAEAIWSAVLAIVTERMRAAAPISGGALPTILGVPHEDDPHAARTVTLADVHTSIRVALQNVPGYAPLPRMVRVNRMAVKMAVGGCSDNAIERADHLRLQYQRHWRTQANTPTTSSRRRELGNDLMRIVDETTDRVRTPQGSWGASLWRELGAALAELDRGAGTPDFDVELLLGGVSDLSNQCRVWYSDAFDVAAELSRLRSSTPA
jgi:hypothetical protein